MEETDRALIRSLSEQNPELKRLWDEHMQFETRLDELGQLRYLTEPERVEVARLKRLKLAGKDKIELILAAHRGA